MEAIYQIIGISLVGLQIISMNTRLLLLIAGLIMVVTLWTSKKAKSVTTTRQSLQAGRPKRLCIP